VTRGADVVIGMDLLIGLKFGWDGIEGLGTGSIRALKHRIDILESPGE
jgi:hypothetical protein